MGSPLRWESFRLLTFDCYGTLINWEAGILAVLRPWTARNRVTATDDELLAAFGEVESAAERETPQALYHDILRGTMARLASGLGKTASPADMDVLASSVGDWPSVQAIEGLEIGPGGGRITELLVHRTKVLHLAEPSEPMVRYLRQRFASAENVRYHKTDGMTLPPLTHASLDYVTAFDVFVHFEPRLVCWYLRQIAPLLKPGATAIIHYANVTTPAGWQEFETGLERNLKRRAFDAFGVMCPQLMAKFLDALGMEVVSLDVGVIPRDAVAVFRKPKAG